MGIYFPLSDHDRTQRPASSQHPPDAECLSAFRVSWVLVLILGSKPVSFLTEGTKPLTFILFKRERQVQDEGLEDEYDEDDRLRSY